MQINHRHRAESLLESFDESCWTDEAKAEFRQMATVHAILAVADELRLINERTAAKMDHHLDARAMGEAVERALRHASVTRA